MKKTDNENYLCRVPKQSDMLSFSLENGLVTLSVENSGFFNHLMQRLFKKPKVSFIHLDEIGSFIWQNIDGKKDIYAIGENIKNEFGDKYNPLYERLSKFISVMESYGFITF